MANPQVDIQQSERAAIRTSRLIAFRVAAIFLGIVFAGIVAEIGLRLANPRALASSSHERDLFCRFDSLLGWVPRINLDGVHAKPGESYVVHQNQFGLRADDRVVPTRTHRNRRVLVLGDSYVWGVEANQHDLFSDPRVHGTDQELINFGVSGYGTDQEYLYYLTRGTNFAVDEVILAFTPYNDVANNQSSRQYGYLKPYFTLEPGGLQIHTNHLRASPARSIRGVLLRHSRLSKLVSTITRDLKFKREAEAKRGSAATALARPLSDANVSDGDRAGVTLTLAILTQLEKSVRAQGARFRVIFIPYKPNILNGVKLNHPLARLVAEGLSKAGIESIEPYEEFLEASSRGTQLFNLDDNHFSPDGHKIFARVLTHTNLPSSAVSP